MVANLAINQAVTTVADGKAEIEFVLIGPLLVTENVTEKATDFALVSHFGTVRTHCNGDGLMHGFN